MPYTFQMSLTPQHTVYLEYSDNEVSWRARVGPGRPRGDAESNGIPADPMGLCTSIRLLTSRKTLPPVFSGHFRFAVSRTVKNLIERLEPGVHQFLRLEISLRNRTPFVGEDYFLLNICNRVDAIDTTASVLGIIGGRFLRGGIEGVAGRDYRVVVQKDVVAGMACWHDEKFSGADFMSNALYSELQSRGVHSLDFSPVEQR